MAKSRVGAPTFCAQIDAALLQGRMPPQEPATDSPFASVWPEGSPWPPPGSDLGVPAGAPVQEAPGEPSRRDPVLPAADPSLIPFALYVLTKFSERVAVPTGCRVGTDAEN